MTGRATRIRGGVFGVTSALFLLPFVTVSCPGFEKSFTGMELAIGTTVEMEQLFGASTKEDVEGKPVVLIALGCALLGLLGAVAPKGASRAVALVAGIGGAVLLLMAQSTLNADVAREGEGLVRLRFEVGYWLAILGFVGGAASAGIPEREAGAEATSPEIPSAT